MTPDHLHATVAVAAMRKGKHVMMHKPLGNRMYEARLVIETARRTKLATHLLAFGLGAGNAAIAGWIREGASAPCARSTTGPIGPCGRNTPRSPRTGRRCPRDSIGTCGWAGDASLSSALHAHGVPRLVRFRRRLDGRHGHYSLWPVFTDRPGRAAQPEAWATHTCSIVDGVSRPAQNDFSYPAACTLRFKLPAHCRPGRICSGTTAA